MKKFIASGFAIILVSFCGCGEEKAEIPGKPQTQIKVSDDVPLGIWDGVPPSTDALPDFFPDRAKTGEFPKSMVGVWETETATNEDNSAKWGIKFEPDGSIKKVIHSVAGKVNIAEGGVGAEGPDEDTFYNFVMGPCEARYIPETRMIKVKIIVDYFIMKLPAGVLEGRIEDYFEGLVSEDSRIWKADWLNFGWIKDAAPPDINLIIANPVPLVFTKLDLAQAEQKDNALGSTRRSLNQ